MPPQWLVVLPSSGFETRALFFADVPQALGGCCILCLTARTAALQIDEVAAIKVGNVGGIGKPHECLCALFHASREGPQRQHGKAHQEAVVLIETAGDEARMKTACAGTGAGEPAGEFTCEQDVGQLALLVPDKASIERPGVEVVEGNIGAAMGFRGRSNDPTRRTGLDAIEKQRGE